MNDFQIISILIGSLIGTLIGVFMIAPMLIRSFDKRERNKVAKILQDRFARYQEQMKET